VQSQNNYLFVFQNIATCTQETCEKNVNNLILQFWSFTKINIEFINFAKIVSADAMLFPLYKCIAIGTVQY